MKIIQALVYSNILRKGIMKTTENETKELEGAFQNGYLVLGIWMGDRGYEIKGSGM